MRLCAFTDEISLDFAAALRTCAENGIEEIEARVGTSVGWLRGPADQAARAGRFLAIENEYTTLAGTCARVRRVVDLLGRGDVRIAWDVSSSWWDGESIAEAYRQTRSLLVDVHVRDVAPDPAEPSRHGPIVRFGEGAIDWADVVGRLAADRYDGTLTL